MRGIWSPTAGLGAPPPGRPSALRGAGAEKFGGTAGLGASLLRNPPAPLPLPRPSPPSAWAHVRASPAAREGRGRGAGNANVGHSDHDPGARPSSQAPARPLPRPSPRPSALGGLQPSGPSARPHSQEEAHLLSSEGRGRWPPPRSGFGARAGTTRKRRVLSSRPAEAPGAAPLNRGSSRCK